MHCTYFYAEHGIDLESFYLLEKNDEKKNEKQNITKIKIWVSHRHYQGPVNIGFVSGTLYG